MCYLYAYFNTTNKLLLVGCSICTGTRERKKFIASLFTLTKGIIMQKNFFLFFFFDLNVYYMYELECQFRVSLEIGGKLIQLISIQNFMF